MQLARAHGREGVVMGRTRMTTSSPSSPPPSRLTRYAPARLLATRRGPMSSSSSSSSPSYTMTRLLSASTDSAATTTTTTTTTHPPSLSPAAARAAADAALARDLPLPPPARGIPIVTNALTTARVLREGPARWGLELMRDLGPVARVAFLGRGDIYHVSATREIVDALSKDGYSANFEASASFQRLMADFTTESMTDGERRRAQRRAMAPGFSQDALREYVPVLDDILRSAALAWAGRCAADGAGAAATESAGEEDQEDGISSNARDPRQPPGTIEIQAELRLATIDVANGLLVGMRGLTPRQKDRLQRLMLDWFSGLSAPAVDLPGSRFRRALEARQGLIDMLEPMVAEQRPEILAASREAAEKVVAAAAQAEADMEVGGSSACPFAGSGLPGAPPAEGATDSTTTTKKKKNRSILAFTAAARRELTGEDFTDLELTLQLMGLLLAGVDTSAGSFTLLVLALTQLPEVMARLREEQRAVAARFSNGDLSAPLDKAALDAMPYADAVAKEVQYLYPVAQIGMRTAKADMALAGKKVPAGATLLLNYASAQWADGLGGGDPERALHAAGEVEVDPPVLDAAWLRRHFRPERWMAAAAGGGGAASPSPTLLAFSSGPHVCLGQQLYQLEARCLVARLARHCDLELAADPAEVSKVWRRFGAPGPTERCLWLRVKPTREEGEGQQDGGGVSAR